MYRCMIETAPDELEDIQLKDLAKTKKNIEARKKKPIYDVFGALDVRISNASDRSSERYSNQWIERNSLYARVCGINNHINDHDDNDDDDDDRAPKPRY